MFVHCGAFRTRECTLTTCNYPMRASVPCHTHDTRRWMAARMNAIVNARILTSQYTRKAHPRHSAPRWKGLNFYFHSQTEESTTCVRVTPSSVVRCMLCHLPRLFGSSSSNSKSTNRQLPWPIFLMLRGRTRTIDQKTSLRMAPDMSRSYPNTQLECHGSGEHYHAPAFRAPRALRNHPSVRSPMDGAVCGETLPAPPQRLCLDGRKTHVDSPSPEPECRAKLGKQHRLGRASFRARSLRSSSFCETPPTQQRLPMVRAATRRRRPPRGYAAAPGASRRFAPRAAPARRSRARRTWGARRGGEDNEVGKGVSRELRINRCPSRPSSSPPMHLKEQRSVQLGRGGLSSHPDTHPHSYSILPPCTRPFTLLFPPSNRRSRVPSATRPSSEAAVGPHTHIFTAALPAHLVLSPIHRSCYPYSQLAPHRRRRVPSTTRPSSEEVVAPEPSARKARGLRAPAIGRELWPIGGLWRMVQMGACGRGCGCGCGGPAG